MHKSLYALLTLLFAGILLTGCSTGKQQTITVVGSSALQPLVESASDKYTKKNPDMFINVQGGGSGTGLSQIQQQAVQIGNSDVFAQQKKGIDYKSLTDHKVCVVSIVPIVNKDIKIRDLTLRQLQAVFTGEISNWKQLGGPDLPITIVNRAQGSGTRTVFEQQVMKGQPSKKAQEQDSSGMVRQIVKNTPGSISYVATPYLTKDVAQVKVNGVSATHENVVNNKWTIWSYEHMYTSKNIDNLTKDFLKYVMSDKFQQSDVKQMGYIPVKDMNYTQSVDGTAVKK